MIKLLPKFKSSDIQRMLNLQKQRVMDAILLNLRRIGEQFVVNARNTSSYQDRTGNLRGSIGYVILFDGKQLTSNIDGSREGVQFAKKAIAYVKSKYSQGFVLIGVAGMDYAAAVESLGYDVITSSSKIAEVQLKQAINRIANKLK